MPKYNMKRYEVQEGKTKTKMWLFDKQARNLRKEGVTVTPLLFDKHPCGSCFKLK